MSKFGLRSRCKMHLNVSANAYKAREAGASCPVPQRRTVLVSNVGHHEQCYQQAAPSNAESHGSVAVRACRLSSKRLVTMSAVSVLEAGCRRWSGSLRPSGFVQSADSMTQTLLVAPLTKKNTSGCACTACVAGCVASCVAGGSCVAPAGQEPAASALQPACATVSPASSSGCPGRMWASMSVTPSTRSAL